MKEFIEIFIKVFIALIMGNVLYFAIGTIVFDLIPKLKDKFKN